jgi:hypothetical protein
MLSSSEVQSLNSRVKAFFSDEKLYDRFKDNRNNFVAHVAPGRTLLFL